MKLQEQELRKILDELYLLDKTLRSREVELVKVINKIINLKPEIEINSAFMASLRKEILAEAKSLKGISDNPTSEVVLNSMKKFIYAFYGATASLVIASLAISSFVAFSPTGKIGSKKLAQQSPFEQKVSKLSGNAFGLLTASQGAGSNLAKSSTLGMGGGVGGGLGVVSAPARESAVNAPIRTVAGSASAPVADAKMMMPPYEYKNYHFVYKGAEIKLPSEKMPVYKRIKGMSANVDSSNLINQLNLNFVNLNSFSGQQLQSISLIQRNNFGYSTNVMLDEGMVSIYQNWETWPAAKCGSDAVCYEAQRVKEGDVMTNEEAVAIADAFITEHGIDVTTYGQGEVMSEWRRLYDLATVKENFYFPETIDIVYPSKIEAKSIYDEYNGSSIGLTVSVHIKERKVTSANLTTQQYDASDYAIETDTKKLLALAEKGGSSGYVPEGAQTLDVELGEPVIALTRIFTYKDNQSQELYVPALYFPVKEMPKDANFYRKAVIVPLAKDILAEREALSNPGVPTPMMLDSRAIK